MTLLAGDIGGTKTLLQIATDKTHASPLTVLFEQRYPSKEFPTFDELLSNFLAAAQRINVPKPSVGCIGVAGPVVTDAQGNVSAKVTNLPWLLDEKEISMQFNFSQLRLINDFQAVGFGLDALSDNEVVALQTGEKSNQSLRDVQVLIGAGTGLGQGIRVWRGDVDTGFYDVLGSEGGHGNFSSENTEQIELCRFLLQQKDLTSQPGRVSVEDVLSGRGLVNAYLYYANKYPNQVNDSLTQSMKAGDAAEAVSQAALAKSDELADRALDLFVEIYGGQAGNLSLTCLAKGGVYIAGGVASKIRSRMEGPGFLNAFKNKGPMSEMMEKIPVNLVVNPQVGLKGALLVASRM